MKPSLPKGTRDFLPRQSLRRKYIFQTIERRFQKYGFAPIETPALENLSTLQGKYGDEGDNLLFKVLNNGDYLSKADENLLAKKDSKRLVPQISKRGLRYDLTVPFARFVVMHQNDIQFPFKRYQIQPVWRADRPQKGRYQEFYQCDADVVGSDSLMYESEIILLLDEVFSALGLKIDIRLNNRKVLAGIAECAQIDNFSAMTVALDKLDKIGVEKVITEMAQHDISTQQAQQVIELVQLDALALEKEFESKSEVGLVGIKEVRSIYDYVDVDQLENNLTFDATLARGLSYYTGCIFEVKSLDMEIGSIAAGGRYADLTAVFGLKNVSGVGISFGAERIFDIMEAMDLFPTDVDDQISILLTAFDADSHRYAFQVLSKLRLAGIKADLYPSPEKFKKQMKYADQLAVRYVGIVGPEEVENQQITLKHMESGKQSSMNVESLVQQLS